MDKPSLFISVASCRDWKPQFGASISGLLFKLIKEGLVSRLDFHPFMQASNLSVARELAFKQAVAGGYSHWMCFDDDMMFPTDTFERLLAHDKDIVVANYRRKQPEVKGVCCDMFGKAIDSSGKTGVEEIGFAALGIALMKLENIKDIPAPHFEVVWSKENENYWTEDMVFSAVMKRSGIKIFVDHDLSSDIEHIGDTSFKFDRIKALTTNDLEKI